MTEQTNNSNEKTKAPVWTNICTGEAIRLLDGFLIILSFIILPSLYEIIVALCLLVLPFVVTRVGKHAKRILKFLYDITIGPQYSFIRSKAPNTAFAIVVTVIILFYEINIIIAKTLPVADFIHKTLTERYTQKTDISVVWNETEGLRDDVNKYVETVQKQKELLKETRKKRTELIE